MIIILIYPLGITFLALLARSTCKTTLKDTHGAAVDLRLGQKVVNVAHAENGSLEQGYLVGNLKRVSLELLVVPAPYDKPKKLTEVRQQSLVGRMTLPKDPLVQQTKYTDITT